MCYCELHFVQRSPKRLCNIGSRRLEKACCCNMQERLMLNETVLKVLLQEILSRYYVHPFKKIVPQHFDFFTYDFHYVAGLLLSTFVIHPFV